MANLYQKVEIFDILGPHSRPMIPIGVKFSSVMRTNVPLGCTKFHMNRCNESPLLGENADFFVL